MPITSSGEIALIADIEAEFDQTGTEDISLIQAATDAGVSPNMFSFYGESDVSTPTVTTNAATSVTHNSMVLNGNLTNTGGGSITSHGFYFGTSSNYASNSKYNLGAKGSTGTFNNSRTGLNASTTYYFTAFAVNSAGEAVGTTSSISTAAPPFVATTAALATNSRIYNGYDTTGSTGTQNVRSYHKNGYSGSIYTTLRFNTNVAMSPISTKYLYQISSTHNTAVTNADQMMIYWKNGSIRYYKILILELHSAGGRTFSNISHHSPYGNSYATGVQQATSTTVSCVRAQDPTYSDPISSVAIQFRYS
jgi:hypothetical protein